MKNGIATKPLAELCEFRNGLWKGKKPPYVHVGVIRNTNFNADGTLDDSDIAYHDVEAKQFKSRQLQLGDIILEKSGGGPKQPVGRVITFEKQSGKFSFSNFTSIIRVCNPDELDFRYLHRVLYWYYSSGVTAGMQRRSTGIRNLDFNAYKQLAIPVPPLAEQKRIVAILDEAFGAIAKAKENAEKNLANAKELFDSYLNRVFTEKGEGWEEKKLPEISENLDKLRKPITKSKRIPGAIPYYGASGIVDYVDGHLFDEPLLLISEDGANLLARTYPIAFSVNGKTWVNNHAHVLRFPDHQTRRFVEFYLNSIPIGPWVSGMAQPKLNQAKLNQIPISLPSIDLQGAIVARFEAIYAKSQEYAGAQKAKLTALDELKQSILQKAFTGQLTAKSPELEAVP